LALSEIATKSVFVNSEKLHTRINRQPLKVNHPARFFNSSHPRFFVWMEYWSGCWFLL